MGKIISRKDWGARDPVRRTAVGPVTKLVIHHSTGATLGHDDLGVWVRNIQNYHMDTKDWWDIAYSFLAGWDDDDDDALIFEGRGWEVAGAHTQGYNSTAYALCLLGDGSTLPPKAVLSLISWWIKDALARPEVADDAEVTVHRALGQTACPGDALAEWVTSGAWKTQRKSRPKPGRKPVPKMPVPKVAVPKKKQSSKWEDSLMAKLPVLKEGSRGYHVRLLQWAVNDSGLTTAVDGIFGPYTRRSVVAYQRQRDLAVDGVVGRQTWTALLAS